MGFMLKNELRVIFYSQSNTSVNKGSKSEVFFSHLCQTINGNILRFEYPFPWNLEESNAFEVIITIKFNIQLKSLRSIVVTGPLILSSLHKSSYATFYHSYTVF